MGFKAWMAALAATSLGTGVLAAPAVAQEPIVIGVSTAQTGPAAVAAEWELWGVNLALEEINAAGGVLGRPLKILVMDNKCNPSEAVNAANKLVEAKVVAIEGSHCSSAHLASMKIIQEAKIPMITGIASNPQITALRVGGDAGDHRDLGLLVIFMLAMGRAAGARPGSATTLASTSLLAALTASDGLHLLSITRILSGPAEHAARGIDLLEREIDAPQLPIAPPPPWSGLRRSTRRSRSMADFSDSARQPACTPLVAAGAAIQGLEPHSRLPVCFDVRPDYRHIVSMVERSQELR